MEIITYECEQCQKRIDQNDFDESKWIVIESIGGELQIHVGVFYEDWTRTLHFCGVVCMATFIEEIK